ncbi:HlyD family type I secretion periplasmic adaptor subunit [Phenylobacterium sp.]|jgi:HlyD family type I secretion membrane fusion protein|uniref:HlyD family type I secretion periplasmic adaptor subunit n=1 Tax=Phenylobacterium sp. TaxID=1871053 RepID=UPI002E31974B|nr:HlyD family type I secretion periplasmic adaptor subunit [Phenylobacterium sp.]HEX3364278.1 HlyD family type I secretion periplasmic adaptor subunit [Phenylobacterium sp.]
MKLDLTPLHSSYVAPTFGDDRLPIDPMLERRMRQPMIVGSLIIGILVVGLGLWASLSPLATGITTQGEVRVEMNKKTLRHRESGTIRQVLVQEGQRVRAGQPMILYNDVEARAAYDVQQNQLDSYEAQAARYTAEALGRPAVTYPADLTSRTSDPRVQGLIRDQEVLFSTRAQLFQSQNAVLAQRMDQLQSQIEGQQLQVASIDEQIKLTAEEMAGYQTLYDKGFAPKPLILRYERTIADLQGHRGSLMSDIARMHQQMGETKMQEAANRDTRQSQAADGLRDAQSHIADITPRLTSAKETLDQTVVRAPVDGYVFNLTQFTAGGVTSPGEGLVEVVPADAPIIITAQVPPQDIHKVHVGMDAKVRLTGLNSRWHGPLSAKVIMVSADKTINEKATPTVAFYRADLRIDPKELTKLKKDTQITSGMPASVQIVSGKKTVMGSLISPITDTLHGALSDQ